EDGWRGAGRAAPCRPYRAQPLIVQPLAAPSLPLHSLPVSTTTPLSSSTSSHVCMDEDAINCLFPCMFVRSSTRTLTITMHQLNLL
uniref:Uncharacterized protein n=1 Tax=Triticum urartu TaxID=4572 RepID=A0A8R7U882_TRIUA